MNTPLNPFLLALACTVLYSQALLAQEPEGTRLDPEKSRQTLLSKQVNQESLVWLEAGGEKFIGLWEPDTSGSPLGAVLMLHGEGQTADWPNSLNSLRLNLTDHGWATLSISLPNTAPANIPARSSEANTDVQTSKTGNASRTKNTVNPRIDAATKFLNTKGQYNIVLLGQGSGAFRAASYLAPDSQTKKTAAQRSARALVMINARNISTESSTPLTDLLINRQLPVLDIFYGDHFLDEPEAAARLKAAKKNRLLYYQQYKMMAPTNLYDIDSTDDRSENRLTRRVRGFLNKHAKGVEIEG